jgi:hypothetical protein
MKIAKSTLKRLIREEIENIQQESDQFETAMESWDDWREEQIANDDLDYGEPDESLLIKWMASTGREYIHLLPKIAADIGFYKEDLMKFIKKHGTEDTKEDMAKALKGYKDPEDEDDFT